jgi:hypothetical protein
MTMLIIFTSILVISLFLEILSIIYFINKFKYFSFDSFDNFPSYFKYQIIFGFGTLIGFLGTAITLALMLIDKV